MIWISHYVPHLAPIEVRASSPSLLKRIVLLNQIDP